jgi:hypothetical protein
MPLIVPRAGFRIVRGRTRSWERIAASGNRIAQHFCPDCGTRIYTEPVNPQVVTVRAGTLDDTSWLEPAAQVWTASAQPWACVDGLLSFPTEPSDPTPILRAWQDMQR